MFFVFHEKGNIFIRLTDKCSANCIHCKLSSLIVSSKMNLSLYEKVDLFINEKIEGNFTVTFLGNNILELYDFQFIKKISYGKNIQLSFEEVKKYNDQIIELSRNNKTLFFISLTINSKEDIKDILCFLKLPTQGVDMHIICDMEKYYILLKRVFKKLSYKQYQTFSYNQKNIEIEDFNTKKFFDSSCRGIENFSFGNNDEIIIKTDIHIGPYGEISFHLNQFCNNSIKKITTIDSENIKEDFKTFLTYLKNNNAKVSRCLQCNYFIGKTF